MPKHGDTVNINGMNHSVPRCFLGLLGKLETLELEEIVEWAGFGRWRRIGNPRQTQMVFNIKHYNKTTRTLKIDASCGGYRQEVFVRVSPEKRQEVEEIIKQYPN